MEIGAVREDTQDCEPRKALNELGRGWGGTKEGFLEEGTPILIPVG